MSINVLWRFAWLCTNMLITPSFSISSGESLIPAVSANTTGYPLKSTQASTTSRVVPGIFETIAASLLPERKRDTFYNIKVFCTFFHS